MSSNINTTILNNKTTSNNNSLDIFSHEFIIEDNKHYKTTKINNRRYLGNKYKLLSFIKNIVETECKDINIIADIFAGTGAVSSAFLDKTIITNDILYSNYICHIAWFSNENYSKKKIIDYITYYNSINVNEENYMTENFANTFFSKKDCSKIGFIRENIEIAFLSKEINFREKAILITSLLYAMDKIANTCGHYDSYRKEQEFLKELELYVPIPKNLNKDNKCFNEAANVLIKDIICDLVYIDPPYNSRQYCDTYHLLENVAKWEKPKVTGIARKMNRSNLKSDYCTTNATKAFEDLINNTNTKYILLSYNNMAEKGDGRSNAKISDEDIIRILSNKGEIKIFSTDYKAFTTGKTEFDNNKERLFLCKCYNYSNEIIQSPLNYTGGKFKLLPQILPLFPKNISTFVDLFCGGCNVGININAKNIIFNDIDKNIINLYHCFEELSREEIFKTINNIIDNYGLSKSNVFGYKYYNCNSSDGLSKYNKEGFNKLKSDFNNSTLKNNYNYLMLYVLIIYSFNNQIRFNNNNKFNLPVGKRDFNKKMQNKLLNFIDRIKNKDICFINNDFSFFDISKLDSNSFIYVDPPYLITCATYNEQGKWNSIYESRLLTFLDKLSDNNIKFALSNVIHSKGKTNYILENWLKRNENKYYKVDLDYNYLNSNYQIKDKSRNTQEVLIVNYKIGDY